MLFFACRKKELQPELSAFNKECDCAKEVSAEFLMEEMATPINWLYERKSTDTDTIYAEQNVRFFAKDTNANYTWYIGSEVIEDREFYRFFDKSLTGQTLPITLVVKKKPNLICFPNDDGYDSIVRYLTVAEEFDWENFYKDTNYRFEGVFRMKDPEQPDSIDITIDLRYDNIPNYSGIKRIVITNLEGNQELLHFGQEGINYRQFWTEGHYCYRQLSLHNKWNGEVELTVKAFEGTPCKNYHYKGRRLP